MTNPIAYPQEQPPEGIPIAAEPYYPTLLRRAVKSYKAGKVQPGRLRRATMRGLVPKSGGTKAESSDFSEWGTKDKLYYSWGVGVNEFARIFMPYGAFVAAKTGTATGGGKRYNWDMRFRSWIRRKFIEIARLVDSSIRRRLGQAGQWGAGYSQLPDDQQYIYFQPL